MEFGVARRISVVIRLILVRHGETDANREGRLLGQLDPGLNDAGRLQASGIAARIGPYLEGSLELISSPKLRARQTAEELSSSLGVPIRIEAGLVERHLADFDGMAVTELDTHRRALGHSFRDPTQDWSGVDSVEQDDHVCRRALKAIGVSPEPAANSKVAVTHAGVIKSIFHIIFSAAPGREGILKIRNGGALVLVRRHDTWAFEALLNPVAMR
jgi:probable phosphoglycerate mutase